MPDRAQGSHRVSCGLNWEINKEHLRVSTTVSGTHETPATVTSSAVQWLSPAPKSRSLLVWGHTQDEFQLVRLWGWLWPEPNSYCTARMESLWRQSPIELLICSTEYRDFNGCNCGVLISMLTQPHALKETLKTQDNSEDVFYQNVWMWSPHLQVHTTD